jgi:hypothetical protein
VGLLEFIRRRTAHSRVSDDTEFNEPDEIKKIGNIMIAPAPIPPTNVDKDKEVKQ